MQYKSYNSKYPIEYYKIGGVYAFYGNSFENAQPASTQQVQRYANRLADRKSSLEEVAEESRPSSSNRSGNVYGSVIRYIGVVVDKHSNGKDAIITVMFKNMIAGQEEFLLKKYGVALPQGSFFDGKQGIEVSSATSFKTKNENTNRIGGVTLPGKKDNKVGGITRIAKSKQKNGIGGITHIPEKTDSDEAKPKKVGGITLFTKE